MIESINQAGGGGGGLEGVTAGTGISVDNTNPDNPIITNTSLNTDETAKVSSNDTTAGYLNGKLVAGSGISLTENNNGGNETLGIAVSNLDASAIITGTIGTARLATGTANSSTYLRGDQTWATISAGDTIYTVTAADAENTTNNIDIVKFTVPANTWANQEIIFVDFITESDNQSGSTVTTTTRINIGGTQHSSHGHLKDSGEVRARNYWRQWLFRDGTNVRTLSTFSVQSWGANSWGDASTKSNYWALNTTAVAATFTSDIEIKFQMQFSVANATVFTRVYNARAYKHAGQVT